MPDAPDQPESKHKTAYGLKPANDLLSFRLGVALKGVRYFQKNQTDPGSDKMEIIVDLMRGANGATIDDVVAVTGWPLDIVRATLSTFAEIVEGGQVMTLVNEKGTKHIYRIQGWDDPTDI